MQTAGRAQEETEWIGESNRTVAEERDLAEGRRATMDGGLPCTWGALKTGAPRGERKMVC